MPCFDIVSKINLQEVDNAINSVLRELTNRYDFKGAKFTLTLDSKEMELTLTAPDEYKLEQIGESLKVFAVRRNIDARSFDFKKEEKIGGGAFKQIVKLRNGIEQEAAKKIVKQIKDSKIKVQGSIRSDEIRVDGKKRDDLQEVMNLVKSSNPDIAMQFINFRD